MAVNGQTPQHRWGPTGPQQASTAPPPPVPPNQGWQQQSKWRRKLQQQQSTMAQTVVYLSTAQVQIAALSPNIAIGGPPWTPQSKWRRKTQQQQSAVAPVTPTIVSLTTAQVNVAALAPTVPVSVSLAVAQVTVAALTPVVQITTPPPIQGQVLQARWGQRDQLYPPYLQPPKVVSLTTAQVTVAALVPSVIIQVPLVNRWLQQSKWRRRRQQQRTAHAQPVPGSGAAGNIVVTYLDPTSYAMLYSLSGLVGVDQFGNQIPVAYQGPVSAFQPLVVTPTITETWHQLSLTGVAQGSGNGVNGFFYRYTPENEVELIWDIDLLATSGIIGTLPSGYIPPQDVNQPSGWYGTGPVAYSTSFPPIFTINGRPDTLPGSIALAGTAPTTLFMFGHDKYSLDL